MKKILLLTAFLISSIAFAQIPQGISYQAIAMNGTSPVASSNVGVRLSILNGSASGTLVYAETHVKLTNAQGLFNLTIGQGTPVSGTFAGINWGSGSKFLKVEMDIAGGTNYALVGTTQLLSSPYAMVAGGLVLPAGQGITLTSPNGTAYVLSVNDAGELSLPMASNPTTTMPSQLYLYGTFNSWNTATSLDFDTAGGEFNGYRYFTAGSQIKFLASQDGSTIYGGSGGLNGNVVLNGNPITINSPGFYNVNVHDNGTGMVYSITSIDVKADDDTMSYNAGGNYFYVTFPGGSTFDFYFSIGGYLYGDNVADGWIDAGGSVILNPTYGNTHLVKLFLNFNRTGNYTITNP